MTLLVRGKSVTCRVCFHLRWVFDPGQRPSLKRVADRQVKDLPRTLIKDLVKTTAVRRPVKNLKGTDPSSGFTASSTQVRISLLESQKDAGRKNGD